MGGVKKKPLSAVEKALKREEERKGKETKQTKKEKVESSLVVTMSDEEVVKLIRPLKAITIHGVSRTMGIKASVASSLLRSLETKKVVAKAGGWSGHYVWKLTS